MKRTGNPQATIRWLFHTTVYSGFMRCSPFRGLPSQVCALLTRGFVTLVVTRSPCRLDAVAHVGPLVPSSEPVGIHRAERRDPRPQARGARPTTLPASGHARRLRPDGFRARPATKLRRCHSLLRPEPLTAMGASFTGASGWGHGSARSGSFQAGNANVAPAASINCLPSL